MNRNQREIRALERQGWTLLRQGRHTVMRAPDGAIITMGTDALRRGDKNWEAQVRKHMAPVGPVRPTTAKGRGEADPAKRPASPAQAPAERPEPAPRVPIPGSAEIAVLGSPAAAIPIPKEVSTMAADTERHVPIATEYTDEIRSVNVTTVSVGDISITVEAGFRWVKDEDHIRNRVTKIGRKLLPIITDMLTNGEVD